MSESITHAIEHPSQEWWNSGTFAAVDTEHQDALRERFEGYNIDSEKVIAALGNVTLRNHVHRQTHESTNLHHLGLKLITTYYDIADWRPSPQRQLEYRELAGNPERVGEFVSWFSHLSHQAFVAQERKPDDEKFERVSLELGGKRQFGDWECTTELDDMIRAVPSQLLRHLPHARIVIYGNNQRNFAEHPNIKYVKDTAKSYTLFPQYSNFATAVLRRRRPVADVYIPGQSDVVIFKESIGLLVINAIEPKLRDRLLMDMDNSIGQAYADRSAQIKLQDTLAARIGGFIFETAIYADQGVTADVIPVSAHYVQGVGERYATLRHKQANSNISH